MSRCVSWLLRLQHVTCRIIEIVIVVVLSIAVVIKSVSLKIISFFPNKSDSHWLDIPWAMVTKTIHEVILAKSDLHRAIQNNKKHITEVDDDDDDGDFMLTCCSILIFRYLLARQAYSHWLCWNAHYSNRLVFCWHFFRSSQCLASASRRLSESTWSMWMVRELIVFFIQSLTHDFQVILGN